MILHDGIKIRQMLWDTRRFIAIVLVWTALVVFVDEALTIDLVANTQQPVTMLGLAVAFFLGFKNTSAFARWWEARNVWGDMVNASRDWGIAVGNLVASDGTPIDPAIRRELIERHIAWLNMLAFQLRAAPPVRRTPRPWMFGHAVVSGRREMHQTEDSWRDHQSDADLVKLEGKVNKAAYLLFLQGQRLSALAQEHKIDPFWHVALTDRLARFANGQGQCERLKNTPFPRQIAEVGNIFSWIFIFMLPLAFNEQQFVSPQWDLSNVLVIFFHWVALAPIGALVCWVFMITERVGVSMEDPFDGGVADVPISAICRNIEIDLRQMTGWGEVPPPPEPIGRALF